jgi:hypothetical protein
MTIQRKLLLLALMLLLLSVGIVVAQSSTNYVLERSVMLSGGASESANYSVSSVIGQPATDLGKSANYQLSAGFLQPNSGSVIFLPIIVK